MQKWEQLEQQVIECRQCPRLVAWREQVARERKRAYREWEYWGKPVPGFGDRQARLLVVGLAPGAHGANRTGRMFTGDGSGEFLYRALHQAGFANQPTSRHIGDGLALAGMYISAVCRCAPPANKPCLRRLPAACPTWIASCICWTNFEGIVALGRIAFDNTLRILRNNGHSIPRLDFAHAAEYNLGADLPWLIASYHPSRQNTQTGRLTPEMFDAVWQRGQELLGR